MSAHFIDTMSDLADAVAVVMVGRPGFHIVRVVATEHGVTEQEMRSALNELVALGYVQWSGPDAVFPTDDLTRDGN
jgi:hypothetical protein